MATQIERFKEFPTRIKEGLPLCQAIRVAGLVIALSIIASTQAATVQARSEIESLRVSTRPLASDPELTEEASDLSNKLQSALTSLDSGHLYVALETVIEARVRLAAAQRTQAPDAAKMQSAAFEKEWQKSNLQLKAARKNVSAGRCVGEPAAVRALSETASGKADFLLEASRPYARMTNVKNGLYYIGAAKGAAQSATFLCSLHISNLQRQVPYGSILEKIEQLQNDVNNVFEPPKSIDFHPQFIQINASIKLARELDGAKHYEGALYNYLLGVQKFGVLEASAVDDSKKHDLLREFHEAEKAGADGSIAEIFRERATELIEKGDTASPDDWKTVQALLERVLPAYYAAASMPAQPAVPTKPFATVTLVRWPYT